MEASPRSVIKGAWRVNVFEWGSKFHHFLSLLTSNAAFVVHAVVILGGLLEHWDLYTEAAFH